jgi:hypothetical protein
MKLFTGHWFGVFSITWWPCVLVWFSVVGTLMLRWFAYTSNVSPTPSSYAELFSHVSTFSGQAAEEPLSNRTLLRVTVVTSLLLFGSVLAGDTVRNQPCVRACKDAGWSTGRTRGNPHDASNKGDYACWCQRGSTWSESSIPEAALRPAHSETE